MLSRWVPLLRPRGRPRDNRFNRSLVRDVVIGLLLISLFPVVFIGTLNFFRARDLLRRQTARQIESMVMHEVDQLKQHVDVRNKIIDRLVTDEDLNQNLFTLLNSPDGSFEQINAKTFIYFNIRANPATPAEDFFDNMILLGPDGSILLSTNDPWTEKNLGVDKVRIDFIRNLVGTNKAVFAYSPVTDYADQMILFTTRSFKNEAGATIATLVATSSGDLAYRTLIHSGSFLPGANSYYFTQEGTLIGTTDDNRLVMMPDNPGIHSALRPILTEERNQTQFSATSFDNTPVIAFAEWIPEYDFGVVLQVSERSVFELNQIADPFNLVLLGIALIISGSLIYLGSTRLVNPLVHLAETADLFSKGNWSERANIKRNDEIGLLAASFNHMADELSELYWSLERVVQKRTSQLRIASEVAQLATSTTKLSDALGRTAELIAERFGFYHVAIYLFDETGQQLVLKEASGISGEQMKQRGDRIYIKDNTPISWAAVNKQARIITKSEEGSLFHSDPLLPDTQSEVAVPISVDGEVMGVLDIQSTIEDAFDEDTTSIFQTLANQISGTLQNIRVLESTQVSYQETALLYRATRQVTQARSEAEIIQNLTDTFAQLPFIGAVLSVEGENFKILVVTDPKTGRVDKGLQSLNIPLGRMAGLLTENRVALVEDISQPSDYENLLSFLLRRGCKSAALVSVVENGRLSKVLALGAYEANQLSHASLQPITNLAEVIGAALEKYRVLNTLQQRLAELQILAHFSQAIPAETELNNLYRVLHEQVMQTMGTDLEFAIALYNQRENLIEFPYYYEERELRSFSPYPLEQGLTSIVINTRKPLLLDNEQAARQMGAIISGRPPKSWMGIPLIFGGNLVGAVLLQDLENEKRFTQDDVNLFVTLAPQIATAVRNTQLYTETQEALKAYNEEHFLINTLLDNVPEGISFKDVHGRYIRTCETVARLFNLSASEIIGKTDFELMAQDIAEKIFREEQMVMNIGKPEIGLIQHAVLPSGEETWTHTSRIPIRTASGDPYGLLLIQRDITELKQAEALAQRRAGQILTAAEIARDTTGTLDVDILLQKSVNLVRERFGFYHASIFLLDPVNEYAVLRESTGQSGQQMMAAGHRLAVGSKSIVGQVTATGRALIVNNVLTDPTHLPNPLLPDTRSELAIPLMVGERVLGALDVQSTQTDAFNAEDVGVLKILADQLAVAVVNGDLFAKTQELLGKHRLLRQISITASASTSLEETMVNVVSGLREARAGDRVAILMLNEEGTLQVQTSTGYEGTRHLELRIAPGQGITGQAALEKRPIRVDDTLNDARYLNIDPGVRSELAIPILFSDELLGVLNLESTQPYAFDENDQEILGALGNNLGGVVANLRLVNQVRQQVILERQMFEVATKIRRSVDLETILETSAQEIARALGARRARIRVTAREQQSQAADTHPNGGSGNGKGPQNGHKNGQEAKE